MNNYCIDMAKSCATCRASHCTDLYKINCMIGRQILRNERWSVLDSVKFFSCEGGKITELIHDGKAIDYPAVANVLYNGTHKNFDLFKGLVAKQLIEQTNETKAAVTALGKPKFTHDSISANAKYICTEKTNDAYDKSRAFKHSITLLREIKAIRKSHMSIYEYTLMNAIAGKDVVNVDEFIENYVKPELEAATDKETVNYIKKKIELS